MQRVSDTVVILNKGALVAQGPIEELLVWGQAAAFTLTVKGDSAAVEARLRSQPWVTGIEEMSRNGRVQLADSGSAIRIWPKPNWCRWRWPAAVSSICEFGRKAQNLEDVFLSIVKESNHERE